jgi:hypothetical protein
MTIRKKKNSKNMTIRKTQIFEDRINGERIKKSLKNNI